MKNLLITFLLFVLVFSIINTSAIPLADDSDNTITAVVNMNPKSEKHTRIMTYNLLSDSPGFEGSSVYTRANDVCSVIQKTAPDIAGLQEVSRNWLFCLSQNTDYKIINAVKNAISGTMTVIAYNPETILLLESGERIFSDGTHTRLRRIVWGVFERKYDGKRLCVINTHLTLSKTDGEHAVKQAIELSRFINEMYYSYNLPVFLTGDFNSGERKENCTYLPSVYEIICSTVTDARYNALKLNNGIGKNIFSTSIDHIFIRGNIIALNYTLLSQTQFSKLSDHYPVFVDFII